MRSYNAIFEWNMNTPEADTYKIALIWQEQVNKYTEDILKTPEWRRRNCLPTKKDPRKSYLFRYCWKLRRETRGLLKNEDFPLYIIANLSVLKAFGAYMEINTLCGDNAWLRWKIWKRNYDKKIAQVNHNPAPPVIDSKVNKELLKTKKFIFERCDGEPDEVKIADFVKNGFLKLWVLQGKISHYYMVMSPYIQPFLNKMAEDCGFDRRLFEGKLNEDIKEFFRIEFSHEFNNAAT